MVRLEDLRVGQKYCGLFGNTTWTITSLSGDTNTGTLIGVLLNGEDMPVFFPAGKTEVEWNLVCPIRTQLEYTMEDTPL